MKKTLVIFITFMSVLALYSMRYDYNLRSSQMSRQVKDLLQQASKMQNQPKLAPKPTTDLIKLLEKQFESEKHDPSQQQRTAVAIALAHFKNNDLAGRIRWLTTAFNLGSKYAAQELQNYYEDTNKKVAQVFAVFKDILALKESRLITLMPSLEIYYPELKYEVNQSIGLNDNARLAKALDKLQAIVERERLPGYGNDLLSNIAKLRQLNQ